MIEKNSTVDRYEQGFEDGFSAGFERALKLAVSAEQEDKRGGEYDGDFKSWHEMPETENENAEKPSEKGETKSTADFGQSQDDRTRTGNDVETGARPHPRQSLGVAAVPGRETPGDRLNGAIPIVA